MRDQLCSIAAVLAIALPCTAGNAAEISEFSRYDGVSPIDRESLPYLQCVPYARQVSGIQIYGDALTWWDQAEGRYARGHKPKVGAVMSFAPFGNMELGHVAAVSKIIDSRNVLLRHANWSPIDGRRGQIEDNVRAVDVSERNDWSEVRVWYAPIENLGTTAWPVNGFIYPEKPGRKEAFTLLASARVPSAKAAEAPKSAIGADFLKGIRPEVDVNRAPVRRQLSFTYAPSGSNAPKAQQAQTPRPARLAPALADDPIGRIIASRTR